jgi:hypothetical protein
MKIIDALKTIKIYAGYFTAAVTVIGTLWGAFTVYNKWQDNSKEMDKNVRTIISTQASQQKLDSILIKNQNDIQIQLTSIGKTTNSLQKSYVNYISNDKTLTKQDFLRYMDGLSFDMKRKIIDLPPDINIGIEKIQQK